MQNGVKHRIETELEVSAYIQDLKYALAHGATIDIQGDRLVDKQREEKYTNNYTIASLFPDEDPAEALKRELYSLTVEDYMGTVKDLRFPSRSEMREFGKECCSQDVYIKIRVELLGPYGNSHVFVMSFHFAEKAFTLDTFPYKRKN